jgi:hypothetical protein
MKQEVTMPAGRFTVLTERTVSPTVHSAAVLARQPAAFTFLPMPLLIIAHSTI